MNSHLSEYAALHIIITSVEFKDPALSRIRELYQLFQAL